LPDLYDQSTTAKNLGGMGRFEIMSNVNGWDFDSSTPGHLSAYCREMIGWVDPIRITADGYYAIQPLEISSHIYRIDHGFPPGEYLLIESKQSIKWDGEFIYTSSHDTPSNSHSRKTPCSFPKSTSGKGG
jgi:M6 family metalloprotease-like protein